MGYILSTLLNARNTYSLTPSHQIAALEDYGPLSRPLPNTETPTSSAVYRNGHRYKDDAHQNMCNSTYYGHNCTQRFYEACEKYAHEPRIAYRPVIKRVREKVDGVPGGPNMMEVTYLGETQRLKLGDVWKFILSFSRGLAELGLSRRCNVSIYEETRWEWLATIYGIWMQDMVASTVYANLGEDALYYALRETECAAIVCNGRNVPLLLQGVGTGHFPACTIIYLDDLPASGCAQTHGCRLIAWKDVLSLGDGRGAQRETIMPKDNDTVALIMYTSGTTGDPKGVVHTHGSIISGVAAMERFMDSLLPRTTDERYCAYLPLAHILEFGVVNVFLSRGAAVGFGSPRTLTNVTAKPHGDFAEYQPCCIVAVPRVFDTVRRAVEAKLPAKGSVKRQVWDTAYQSRLTALQQGKDTPYWNEKVFKQARAALGGRFRLLLSGGGPLSSATQEFVNVVFGFLINGYGLTESICVGAIQRIGDLTPAAVGQVLEMEELKLIDAEEYKHTDKPQPRGEICLRGPFLFKGYYKQPELTKEAIDEDGWFHTGDIGSIDSEGRVSVIGRIKALAKNCLGEYIALETLEAIYSNHYLVVNNCACVIVRPERRYIAVICATAEFKVRRFVAAHQAGLPAAAVEGAMPIEEIIKLPEFCAVAAESMAAMGRDARRLPFELPREVCFVLEEWTPENDILTAAMKLKRRVINERFRSQIDEMFVKE